jgi:hypothetical protein
LLPNRVAAHAAGRWVLWSLGCVWCLGCGGGDGAATAPVSGVVTYRGKPLADVNVVFMSRGGAPATGVTNSEGRFELTTLDQTGAVPGAHQVTITPNQGAIDMPLPGQPPAKPKSAVPAKYGRAESSGLTAEVKAGEENQFTFELTD